MSRKGHSVIVRSLVLMSLVAVALSLGTGPGYPFKPRNNLRQTAGDRTHQSMTEEVFRSLAGEFFGIENLPEPMEKALQQITDANAGVDLGSAFFSGERHFDGEAFAGGQAVLIQGLRDAVSALQSSEAKTARARVGEALHTLQDFYSHTTWIELGHSSPNPSVGVEGQLIRDTSPPNETTCTDCTPCVDCAGNVVSRRLTSGYFGVMFASKPAGKCSHGGTGDRTSTTSPRGGINKDTLDCFESPHRERHATAAAVARAATEGFFRLVKDKTTDKELRLLFGVGPTLAIAIDTTNSMEPIIDSVKAQAIQIVDSRVGTDQAPTATSAATRERRSSCRPQIGPAGSGTFPCTGTSSASVSWRRSTACSGGATATSERTRRKWSAVQRFRNVFQ